MHYHCLCLMWSESDRNNYRTKFPDSKFCPICQKEVLFCKLPDEKCRKIWKPSFSLLEDSNQGLVLSGVHAYTIEASVTNSRGQGFVGLQNESADLNYRLDVALKGIFQCLRDVSFRPMCSESSLVTICFPEFFFRGGPKGYYTVSPLSEDVNDEYDRRALFVNRFFKKILPLFVQTIESIWPKNRANQAPPIAVCVGSIPVGTGVVQTFESKDYMIIDNFSLVLTYSSEKSGHKIPTANMVLKRNPSAVDFLTISNKPGGQFVPHPNYPKQFAHVVNSIGMSAEGPISNFGIPQLNLPPLIILPHISTPWGHTIFPTKHSSFPEVQFPQVPYIENPRVPGFTIGVSTCLDYLRQTGFQYKRHKDQFYRDLIFVPAAGISINMFDRVGEGADRGIIVHSDGAKITRSNVAVIESGRVQFSGSTFANFPCITETKLDSAFLESIDDDWWYTWFGIKNTPISRAYRGYFSYLENFVCCGSPVTPPKFSPPFPLPRDLAPDD